ncbi:auxin family transmembrane transporter [Lichtheimia corymbifera JMRC:FSU:9682]|uniref:Auxin family transmembrane transporter n=1 Tax=Lichtheimia corymbifera JMRC:FSU:9682 TaxID=1263082 RepID=A0A068RNJ4_9FUNG|nr:auxin family transmembrane transporter [Lichtheimia corymbifera JMRC:FSU:9682]
MLLLIISAIQAVLQVMVVVLFGFCLTKLGFFTNDKQKWLSKLNLVFFTPCLMFSNIASTISMEHLLAFWPIPAFFAVYATLTFTMGNLMGHLFGLNAPYRRFVLACAMFGNTNSLPIAIITSLAVSEAGKTLFWNEDDTQESVAARGVSYILFFAIFGNLLRWSYGYSLLQKLPEDEEEFNNNIDDGASGRSSSASSATNYGATNDAEQGRRQMPDRTLSSTTLTAAIQPEDGIKAKAHQETSSLLPTSTPSPTQSLSLKGTVIQAIKRIHSFMSPPLYAAFLGLLVGLTPLKHVMYDKDSFLYPCFTKAIESCGRAAVPLILTCLGAQLTIISQSQQPASPAMKKPVFVAILVRVIIMACFSVPITCAFVIYGSQWSLLASDPVFVTLMIVLGCTPTAINLVQITQVNAIFEEEMLRMLFWSYGVVCVPVCTVVVFVALSVVDKLL